MGMIATSRPHRIRFGLAIALAALAMLGASATHAESPRTDGATCGTTQRISFAPGTDHGTVRGSFCEGQDNRFVLRAAAGQTMTVSGIEAGTAFGVIAPDGSTLPGGPGETISYLLPSTGDYTILHGTRRSEVSTFEFTVTIPPLDVPSPPPTLPATR